MSTTAPNTRIQPLRALRALRALLRDKEDTSQVFEILRALSGKSFIRNFRRFQSSEAGRRVLSERRELVDCLMDRDALARLPAGSLGRAYLDFMIGHEITADGLVEESEKAGQWVGSDAFLRYARRVRDMHDLWHVLTGYGRDGFGEVCLVAFSFPQMRNVGWAVIAVGGAMKFSKMFPEQRGQIWKAAWQAYRNGRRSRWLPEQDWEALLAQPLRQVRTDLGIDQPSAYVAAPDVIDGTRIVPVTA